MSNSILRRAAAAALTAAVLLPAAALAQSTNGTTRAVPGFGPDALAGGQAVCTQLELSVGLQGDECGQLTLAELSLLKAKRDNTY